VPAEVNSVFNKDRIAAAAEQRGYELVAVAANTSTESRVLVNPGAVRAAGLTLPASLLERARAVEEG
jgi:ABC-type uncharacterized transport system substrate-binding protein